MKEQQNNESFGSKIAKAFQSFGSNIAGVFSGGASAAKKERMELCERLLSYLKDNPDIIEQIKNAELRRDIEHTLRNDDLKKKLMVGKTVE